MDTVKDLCFLCTKDDCTPVDEKTVSQVEYLIPEITITKLGIPLGICSDCDESLCSFNEFKKFSVESSRCLEARIKGAQGPPLHTASPPVVDNNKTSGAKPEKTKDTSLGTQMPRNRAFLSYHYQLHKDKVSQMAETSQDRDMYRNKMKEKCRSNAGNDDLKQPEDKSVTLNKSDKVWEGSSSDSEEKTVNKTAGNWPKNIQTDTKKVTHTPKYQEQLKKLQKVKERCYICSKVFASKAILARHMKKNHWRLKDLFCSHCKIIFTHKYDLNKHMDLHNGIKNYPCFICKKKFINKHNLKQHILLHSGSTQSECHEKNQIEKDDLEHTVSCSLCNKILQISNFYKHMKTHYENKFQCEICQKGFKTQKYLERHIRLHSEIKDPGENGFQCNICKNSFTTKIELNVHKKSHSEGREFQCHICKKTFFTKRYLPKHIQTHSDKMFECHECGNLSKTKELLVAHKKSHSGVKDFSCKICHKSFISKYSLTYHMKAHSGVKDLQCSSVEKSL